MSFEEYSVSKSSKRNAVMALILNIVSVLFFIVFTLSAIYGVFIAPIIAVISLTFLGLSFLTRYLSARANVSFDYTVYGGTLSIGKIINDKRRKQIFELTAQDIISVSEIGDGESGRKDKKLFFCSANRESVGKTFVLIETKDALIIVEAGEKLFSALKSKSFF